MKSNRQYITVFEHQTIRLNQKIGEVTFDEHKLNALQSYYGNTGVPYYTLIHNGVCFNEYVGVIQIGETVIEVLPKADLAYDTPSDKKLWRNKLIEMLYAVGIFDIQAPSSSSLKLKSNCILDLYFELFINEVEYLLHNGLVKQYRKKQGNVLALKGSLQFARHIQQNLNHHERFYVNHSVYNIEHQLHYIIYKTILLINRINTNASLHSRIGALLLYFPEMPDIKIHETTFAKLVFNRKTKPYKNAIDIAKLLLLQFHPDVSRGRDNILALMFDMNKLWEQFVLASLLKHKDVAMTVTAQTQKKFWKPINGYTSKIRPDIVINKDKEDCMVLDTKWKNLKTYNPSPDDLRQMYVYHVYYHAKKVALVYPGSTSANVSGTFIPPQPNKNAEKICCIISIAVKQNIKEWQKSIYSEFMRWANLTH